MTQARPQLTLRYLDPADLDPNPHNFRTHPAPQVAALGAAIGEVGWAGALLYNERTKRLIDGHARKEMFAGKGSVPVLCGEWSEDEEKVILATLDPIGAMAIQDAPKLQALLGDLRVQDAALKEMLKTLAEENPLPVVREELTDPDAVPEAPAEPVTRGGDLWVMGGHRLLCGDNSEKENVARLMDSAQMTCLFTDPPYGVSVGAKNRLLNSVQPSGRCLTDIRDDDLSPDDLKAKLLVSFKTIYDFLADDCSVFVCSPQGGGLSMMMMMMMMQEACLSTRHIIIWKKNAPTFSMGRLDYDYQHEPILFTWKKTHKRKKEGAFGTTIWEVDKPRASSDHPTKKPVELPKCAILNHTDTGDIVGDIYCGSGTTIIASEQLGRRCFAVEISPQYVDVAVRRWCEFTGKDAVRESDGASFRELLTRRDGEGTMKP